jgi:hypothetical protein
MDRVEEMRAFVAELTANHVNRSQALRELSNDVQTTLQTFRHDRKAMTTEMQAMLDKARNDRSEAVATIEAHTQAYMADVNATRRAMSAAMFDSLHVSHAQLSSTVVGMLGQFEAERKAMAEVEQSRLAAARSEREAHVASLRADAQATVHRIGGERRAMAEALSDELAHSRAQRQASVVDMLAEFQAALDRTAVANRSAAEELHSFLNVDSVERRRAVAELMAGISAGRQSMSEAQAARLRNFKRALDADVSSIVAGMAKDRAALQESLRAMGAVWREYAAAMRGQVGSQVGSGVEHLVKPTSNGEAAPANVDSDDMEREILEFLVAWPEGVKLVEMEAAFGLSRPVIGRQMRQLIDAGKVVKDSDTLLYKLA